MADRGEIIIYQTPDGETQLDVRLEKETVWLTQQQMSVLFGKDQSVITRHIRNIFKEQELDEKSNMQILHNTLYKYKPTAVYNLDVIISVGYRVKSQNGVVFRRWANSILKQYLINGYAVNQKRIEQLGEVIRLLKRTQDALDSKQVLSVIEHYNEALNLLDSYDHQSMKRPEGNKAIYTLTYEECREVIGTMRFGNDSEVFGIEKDDSFKGSIGNIYQSYGGQDVYPTLEEKAANLLYFVTKNHSFVDGNKRIAATMFLYFLDKNQALFIDGNKAIDDYTLVALTIMIAESRPEEKEMMISVVMNCMK